METERQPVAESASQPPAAVCKLPSFPPVAMRLLQVLSNDDADISQAIKLIESDPAFGIELLHMANSPLFGCVSRINSVRHAVVVIGLERTRSVAMAIAMKSYLKKSLRTSTVRQCWRHTLACAIVGQEFCRAVRLTPDRAFTAGVVHDVGRLGLLSAYPEKYSPLLAAAHDSCADVLAAERALFDVDHCEAGYWLSRTWGFPYELCEVAARHHSAAETTDSVEATLARAACQAADALGFAAVKCDRSPKLDEIRGSLPEQLQLQLDCDFDELRERIGVQIAALEIR